MLCSLQNALKSVVQQLLQLLRIRSLLLLTVFCLIYCLKCQIYQRLILSIVQLFLLTINIYVKGRPQQNYIQFSSFPFRTRNRGIVDLSIQAPQIKVTYLVLVGFTCFSLPSLSISIITFEVKIQPIQKLALLRLYIL